MHNWQHSILALGDLRLALSLLGRFVLGFLDHGGLRLVLHLLGRGLPCPDFADLPVLVRH